MKRTITGRFLAALALVGGSMSMAWAADAPGVEAGGRLSPAEIVRGLEAKGYTNVHDLEFDDGRWEAEATSTAGAYVDLEIDPATGKVVHEEND